MAFVTDLAGDPVGNRVVFGLYGRPGTGKTTLFLDLVRCPEGVAPKDHTADPTSQRLCLFSADKGTLAVTLNPEPYQGRLAISRPDSLRELRKDLREVDMRIARMVDKGTSPRRIWAVVDTTTALQTMLLTEARKIDVTGARKGKGGRIEDDYERDMVTPADYTINLTHVAEVVNALLALPCNIGFTFLEKTEKDEKRGTSIKVPMMSGQARELVVGHCDVLARVEKPGEGEERLMHVSPSPEFDGKDRTGRLDKVELVERKSGLPDLVRLYQKILRKAEAPASE